MSFFKKRPPIWFWGVSAIVLVWNLLGAGVFLFEVLSDADGIRAAYPAYEAEAVLARPVWVTVVFGVAVFAGALGCIFLLARKKSALALLYLSALAVFIQQFYMWGMTDIASHLSGANWIMPILIPIIAVFLVYFAQKSVRKKWIN